MAGFEVTTNGRIWVTTEVLALEPIKRIVPTTMTRIHRQHNRILGDILGFVLTQYVPEKINHSSASCQRSTRRKLQTSVRRGGDSEERIGVIASELLAFTPDAPQIVHL